MGITSVLLRTAVIASDIRSIQNVAGNAAATALVAAMPYASAYITADIISYFNNLAIITAVASTTITFVTTCLTGGMGGTVLQIVKTVTGWIINYFAPSYPNAFKMIYYGAKLGKGSTMVISGGGTQVNF